MFKENIQEHIPAGSKRSTSNNRRFGTDLTKIATKRKLSVANPPQQSIIPDDYTSEIFKILHNIESIYLPDPYYMKSQVDINEQMRGILLDWLVTIQLKFQFSPETLFLTANILDRYLEKHVITRKNLQLVGISAMFISCKYEETNVPEIRDLIYISANTYSKDEIMQMEVNILTELKFNISIVTPLKFLERYSEQMKFNQIEYYLARYFVELSIVEYSFIKYKPSIVAAAAVYLVEKNRRSLRDSWIDEIPYYYTEIRECILDFITVIGKAEISPLQAVRNKFLLTSHNEVAKIPVNLSCLT